MSQNNIGALLGSSALALNEAGLPLLAMDLPDQPVAASPALQGVTLAPGERLVVQGGVAYVPVRGILSPNSMMLEQFLGWSTYHGLEASMAALVAQDEVRAVVVMFDTPGGAVLGIQGAVAAIKACAAQKPVHALVHPLAASAGYWLASQCSDITLTPGSWVGSVGAMMTGQQPLKPGASGDQGYILTSAHAGAKRPDLSTDDGRAISLVRLDAMEDEFHAAVAAGRGVTLEDLRPRLSRTEDARQGGDVFWGDDAVARGLVDSVETQAAFMARIADLYAPQPRAIDPSTGRRSKVYLARAAVAVAAT